MYALKHGYTDLVTKIVPLLLNQSLEATVRGLSGEFIMLWVRSRNQPFGSPDNVTKVQYHTMWKKAVHEALDLDPKGTNPMSCNNCCANWEHLDNQMLDIMSRLAEGSRSLQNLNTTFGQTSYYCCTENPIRKWHNLVEVEVSRIPEFLAWIFNEKSPKAEVLIFILIICFPLDSSFFL